MSKYTVVIIGNYAPDEQISMIKYASLIRDELLARDATPRLVCPPALLGRLAGVFPPGVRKMAGYLDKFVLFPVYLFFCRLMAPEQLFHITDHSNSIYLLPLGARRTLITCHDLIAVKSALGLFPHHQTSFTGRCLQGMIRFGLRRARNLAAISEATRDDLLRIIPAGKPDQHDPRDIRVIPNSMNYPFHRVSRVEALQTLGAKAQVLGFNGSGGSTADIAPEEDKGRADLVERRAAHTLVFVGGNAWYKNRHGALLVLHALNNTENVKHHELSASWRLVFTGPALSPDVREIVTACGLESVVIEAGFVTNAELRSLYCLADGLLFPSITEGFGWPLIEAQACRCPVFTSDASPMREVAGGADCATLLPLPPGGVAGKKDTASADWARDSAAMIAGWYQNRLESRLAQLDKAETNARIYSFEEMMKRYLGFYKDLTLEQDL